MKALYKITYLLITVITLLQATASVAQIAAKPVTKISGLVVDDKGVNMPYTAVALIKAKDSSLVKGAVTNEAGAYRFDRVAPGNYVIRIAAGMGFTKAVSKTIVVNGEGTDISLPAIKLSSSNKNLKEVSITSTKPLVERKIDRTVINVENSVLAAGNSALEILEKAPGVNVDKDDNISLKGKQGVTIMLDGKLTYLSSAQLATLLRSTDGNTIQSIEIITNPSAKFDASGNSGIINIKLKKNRQSGTNGSVTATAGYGAYPKDNESLNINHKEGIVNIFGTFSHGDRQRANDIRLNRIIDSAGKLTYFTQHTFMPQKSYNNTYRIGADFDTSPKNTLGFLVSGYFNGETDTNDNNTIIGSTPTKTDSLQKTTSGIKQSYDNYAINLNDKLTLDTAGQEISASVDYSHFDNTNDAHYDNYLLLPNGTNKKLPVFLQNQSPSSIHIFISNVDYTYPITKKIKLEAGAKYSNVQTNNNLQAQVLTGSTYINDASRTNHFIYDEQIAAGYVNLSKSYKNSSVQVGLRAENTSSNGNSVTINKVTNRNYLNFFPSLFLNHTFNEKNEIGFSYSRRIDRPSYDDLNPFLYYLDQYTYQQGNPDLKPQYTHSFEFNYTHAKTINLSIGYSRTSDVITQLVLTDTTNKTSHQTNLNLQSQDAYNLNINSPYTIAKWWTGNINVNTFYLKFKSNNLDGSNLNDGQLSTQVKATGTFQVTKTFRFETSGNYQSPMTYGLFKIAHRFSMDAGMSKSFANKKFNAKFAVSDIFNTQDNNVSSNFGANNFNFHQKNETRVARLTLTYNFGNSKIKARQHKTDSDEKNRVKSGN